MRKSTSRTLWIIAGILLIVAGLFCIFKPDTIFYSLSFLLGFVMLISGIVDIVIFVSSHRFMAGSGWFLADGILTVLLSLFVLGNEWIVTLTLPIIFGMWMMFFRNYQTGKFLRSASASYPRMGMVYRNGSDPDSGRNHLVSQSIIRYGSNGRRHRFLPHSGRNRFYSKRILCRTFLAVMPETLLPELPIVC